MSEFFLSFEHSLVWRIATSAISPKEKENNERKEEMMILHKKCSYQIEKAIF